METGRVVLIRYTAPGGTRCVGSGLLIDERWVLTADHVAEGSEHRVECDRGAAAVAEVVRSGTPEVDLALLRVDEPFTNLVRLGCARVDRSRIDRVSGCAAVGFPRWRKDGDRRRSAQVEGWLPTAEGLESTADSGLRAGWLTLVGDRIPGAPDIPVGTLSETAPSPWGGMSGAVVVAGDLVVGVVRSHNMAAGGQSLTVTPVTAVDQVPGAAREKFCGALGIQDPGLLRVLPDHVVIPPVKVTELRGQGHLLDFADRVDELAQLHELLTGKQAAPVVLYGLGGVGKSQLAVEYAHAHRDELMVVWTARADDPSVLAADLAALGVAAGAADAAEADIEVQLTATRGWLASHPRWLVIIDNVDDPAVLPAVHRLVPDDRLGQVIITSRISTWPGRYHRLEVIALDTDPAAQLLLRSTADADEQAALSLAGDLGGLPLALQQAASYCEQNGKTLAGYLALFRDTRRQLRLLAAGADGDETVATTWAVSIGQVRQNNPAAAVLLDMLAYLAPDAIPRTLLAATEEGGVNQDREPDDAGPPGGELSPQPADENGVTADPLEPLYDIDDVGLDEALGMLRRYSLIQLTPEAIAVHRLVQAVIRSSHNQEIRTACASAAASLVWRALPKLDHDAWPAYEALLPHTLAAGSHAATAADSRESAVVLLSVAGNYQRERGLYAGARKTLQQALVVTEQAFADDHQRVVDALDMLVVALIEGGDPSAARPHAERALRIAEHEFGPDHTQTLEPANNLGEVLRQLGKPAEGRPYAEKALRIAEHEFGPDHPQTLLPANNLGSVLFQLGKPAEARPYFEQALRIAEHEFGPDHPQTLSPANNLGNVLAQLGKPAEARPYAEQALRIAELTYRPADERVAGYLHRLADIVRQTEPGTIPISLLERSITINEASSGPAGPETIADLRCLAAAMVETGRFSAAIAPLQRVLAADTERFGEHDEKLLPTLTSLADALLALGDPAGALPYLERIVAVTERRRAPDYVSQVAALRKLADAMRACNSGQEVTPVLEKIVRLHDHYGAETGEVADDLRNLSEALLRQNQSQEAQSYLQLAQDIDRRRKRKIGLRKAYL